MENLALRIAKIYGRFERGYEWPNCAPGMQTQPFPSISPDSVYCHFIYHLCYIFMSAVWAGFMKTNNSAGSIAFRWSKFE